MGWLRSILDIADAAGLEVPPLSAAARDDIVARIGLITGDGNPLDAWGSGTFIANLPQALSLFDASPDHDIVVFCRDNSDDPAFDTPELVRTYIDLFTRAAAQSRKPHYLLHSRPGDHGSGAGGATARATASRSSAGCARGCRRSIAWRASPAGRTPSSGRGLPQPTAAVASSPQPSPL